MFKEFADLLNANESFIDNDDDIIDLALETEILLAAIREECDSEEEFNQIVTEGATELELYGLIDNAEAVLEARKTIVRLNKADNLKKIEKRTAIRMAEKKNDALYKAYAKGRKLMIAARTKIYEKYGSKAKPIARKIVTNSRRKASLLKSDVGKNISDKIDKVVDKVKGNNDTK